MDHLAIAADLQTRIAAGEFPVGGKMPSEQSLAVEYEVSRGRVRTALSSLARRGLIVSRPHSGWIVQSRHQVQAFDRMRSFAQWAEQQGRVAGGEIVDSVRERATARQARLLGIRLGEEVLTYTRVRTLDGRLVMVERSTWAPWVVPIVAAMPSDVVSTTNTLAEHGVEVVAGDHRIEAVAASSEDARLLGVRRSSPLLQVHRRTLTRESRIVEFGEDRYVPNAIVFEVGAGDIGTLTRFAL